MIKNPEVFQGKNKLKNCKNYFEGWYFKHSEGDLGVSFIPAIHIHNGEKQAFIQVLTKTNSYYINYDFNEFKYSFSPFFIQIGNNFFSKEKISLDINDEKQDLKISGELYYSRIQEIQKSLLSPNIMGPFSHIPFMECNHAILSMKHNITGKIYVKHNSSVHIGDTTAEKYMNNSVLCFSNGIRIYRKRLGNFISKIIFMVPGK